MGWRAAFIALIAALAPAPAAYGAVFTVTGTGEGGSCTGTSCASLRAASAAAEATKSEADTINVPEGVIQINNDLVVQSEMTINGVDARKTIIDGGAKYRLRTSASGVLTLSRFTIRNGAAGGGDILEGGGIYNAGVLGLQDVRITASRATRGGGIANNLGRITADNLLVDHNVATAAGGGGGIHNVGGSEIPAFQGMLILTDATLFANDSSATGGAGGIVSTGNGALVSISRSTIADNTGGGRGAGGIIPSGSTQLVGSIVARNLMAGELVNCDADRRPTDGNFNVEDDKDCGLAPGGMKPQLATALSNQGGQLDVLTIPTGSDAFNRMPLGDTPCEGTDQRGLSRPQGTACDAGAFEIDQAATVLITEGPSGTITSTSTQFNFQASESGVTVQCDLTGPGQTAGFEECYKSNAQPYSDLADGPYTFSVRAVSAAFPNPPVSTRSFVVNAAGAPNTTITGGPSGPVGDTTPTFTFTSSEAVGSTFQCRVDSAAFATCTSPHTTAALSQGAHTFQVRAIDAAGVVDASPAGQAFTVDTVAPETTLGSGGPTGTVASTSATFTYSSEAGAQFQCALDGAAFSTCPTGYTGLAQGSHTFQVRAVDAVGNVDATPASRTWTVDTVAPNTTIGSGPSGATASTTATFTFTSNEGGVNFQCALDGAAFGACPVSYTGLAQGAHTFQVRAVDTAGNVDASPAVQNWTVDTVAPDTTLVGGPTGATASTSATFTYTSNEGGVNFQCALDGAAFSACPTGYTGLAQGAHTLQARAVDAAGNLDATPASRTWIVDTVAPTATIDASPPRTNDTTPSFTFTANEAGATFQCRTDAGTFALCTSPYTTATLAEGSHTVEVRAIDTAGNQGAAASRTIVVDTTAPAAPTVSGPTGATGDNTPTFTFTGEASASFECRVDAAAFAACSSPHTTAQLADGARTFQVRAVDAAGNAGSAASRSLTVDTAAPAPPVFTAPAENALLAVGTVDLRGTAEANATVQLLENGESAGSSPVGGTGLWNVIVTPTDGTHTYSARTIDAAGNQSTAVTRTIRIDTTMPNTTIASGPTGTTGDTTPTWTFTATEAGSTFECALDGAAHTACPTPYTAPTLSAGQHTLSVRAVDPAGNRDNTPATVTITVDTSAPSVTILSGPAGATNDTTPTFGFSAEAGSTLACRVDTAAFASCSSPHTTAALAEGAHTFEVRATDVAGNPATDSRSFTVDTTAPNTTITGGPTGPTNVAAPTFTFTSTESGGTFQCRVDANPFTSCASPHSPGTLAAGAHTYEVQAIDAAGNPDGTPASRAFTVDTTAPPVPSLSWTTPGTDNTPTFTFTGEAGATFQCRVDSAAFATCSTPFTTAQLADGAHRFEVRAVDAAGNPSTAGGINFTIDTVAPNPPVVAQPTANQWLTASTVTVTGTAEAGTSVELREGQFTRGTTTATGGNWSITVNTVVDGTHTYEATARDTAGNTSTAATRTFRVDTAAPSAPVLEAPTVEESTVSLSGSAEAGSTVEVFEGATSRGTTTVNANGFWGHSLAGVSDGSHTYTARARDAAGNQSAASASRTVVVDTVAPTTTITAGPNGPTNDATPSFSFSAEAGATFQCRVDGATFATCLSPLTTATLAPGQHTFEVRATDTTGNQGAAASRTFTVDTVAPAITITAGPDGATSDTTPTFTFTGEPGAVLACRVDAAAFAACTSPHTTALLSQGPHTFEVRAMDAAGNDATDKRTITVDDGPPAAPLLTGPSGPTNDNTPTFTFTGETTTFQCTLDGVEFPCASPFAPEPLADGPHAFTVRVFDTAGNGSEPATRAFTVDTTQPAPPDVTSGPAGATTDANPAFAFTAAESTVECRLDGPGGPGAFGACGSPKAFSALAPGAYVFFVRTTDAAGNQSTTQRAFTVTQVQQAQPTPVPTVAPAQTPTPTPTPVPNQTIVVSPKPGGPVLVKPKGASKFEPLDVTKGIPLGSEVDVRKGRVTLTSIPKPGAAPETADFYGGMFIVTQKGGITDLKLSEPLTGCPKGQRASASAKKKTRKLWGDGKGAFRTSGKYSAATVRGTVWLVQDSCTTTLTRVTQGVVQVQDFVTKKKLLVKKGKRYTAKAKRR
ncbi:Ig-like domain-containing protein [Solirubrobacter phytolaccae]|uniref:Ig-like domain-containing protein n=1 Tax=Solirubrobacter phytolaccae TaxID=1404360 RepID=A0A9X3ND46_9ACTN|nr:Ig-like domain-containing protein [Solirubrobacter phytolaccae]MDA0181841.1 Ig-like domain-containing protein [Solirubrobacter phytolaccae]